MHFEKIITSALCLVMMSSVTWAQESSESSYYDESSCDNEHFYCDFDDPSMFYRCMDGVFHSFKCPSGLHFSVSSQTCDWPHKADCSGSDDHLQETGASKSGHEQASHSDGEHGSEDHGSSHSSPEESGHSGSEHSGSSGSSSSGHSSGGHSASASISKHDLSGDEYWLSKAGGVGKPWWRPSGVSPGQWQDSVKNPPFQPHVPSEPKEGGESESSGGESEKSSTKKSSAPKAKSGSEPAESRSNSANLQSNEGDCDPSSCQLPSCYCPGTAIPRGLSASSVPQMVMLTFDDEVSGAFYGYYQRLFRPGRYNPNGCPVRGCMYVSGSGTEYDLVYPLYAMGNEIASHTISHKFPHTWWSTASYQDFYDESTGMRENLISRAGLPKEAIKGFRVPFLQLGSDNMYSALYDAGFHYDTSMFTGSEQETGDPIWPFTLDYTPSNVYCQHGPCPHKQYPGMWEIPVQRWFGMDGHSCAMPDGCSATGDAEETLEYLKSNFRRFYHSNRAPFGIFIHARWFHTEHNLDGLDRFIDYLLTIDDVYIVTPSQVLEWMKNPTPLSSIRSFGPWSCHGGATD
ncbi:chitin deacetylase 7-like isoform X1 [Biomphalaria glabrata]|uniref:Chitin deacetylase 7-like isoform X1 n=1 Tax=Biomphalaria glabrata TaxID=6526 RepID=A0A9W3A947_BIOGL|nr:chitin deacetylase 7-like isoform X1 [Biomphalaria glabrata]